MLPLIARRPFGRVRLPQRTHRRPSQPQRTITGFSTRPDPNPGILGLDRLDYRQLREQREKKTRPSRDPYSYQPTRWEIVTGQVQPPKNPIKVYPPPPSVRAHCKDPIAALTAMQMEKLDPKGARARLFARSNPEAAKVGDILLVRQKNGDPFAGICLNIRRRGVDTAILLRNQLTRVGVEMWYKIYSPSVEGIEVVQRRRKRARRARLYYLRQPKHDVGSLQNIVAQYQAQRQALRSGGGGKGRGPNAGRRQHVKSK